MNPQMMIQHDVGGLSHLVEAATALTELVDSTQTSAMMKIKSTKAAIVSDDDGGRSQTSPAKAKKREIFPQKLMEILSDPSLSEVISWLPHGRSFVIIRPDIFTDQVLPKYLPAENTKASTKYPSFTRKLNRWGFRQATRGPDTGAFHHALFRRDQPDLCLQMVCQKSRERLSTPRRTLPPKKRVVSTASVTTNEPTSNTPTVSVCVESLNAVSAAVSSAANVSADEGSVGSADTSRSPLSSVVTEERDQGSAMPFISNDQAFVARTLRERDTAEVVRAAQAMLYEAYMNALQMEGL